MSFSRAVKADLGIYHNEDILFQLTTTEEQSKVKKYYYSYDQQTWYEDFEYAIENENIRKRFSVQRNQQVYFKAEDNAGNTSNIVSSWARIDRTNPTAKISASVSGNAITISANGSYDNESGIANYQYIRDNVNWYTSSSNSYTFTGLADGTYTLYVRCV